MVAVSGLKMSDQVPLGKFSVTFEPSLAIFAGQINKLGLDIRSFKEPLTRAIREVMTKSIQANFDAGGRPLGWKPISEETPALRRNIHHWEGGSPLVQSGRLMKVVTQINFWTITDKTAVVQGFPDSVSYGRVHQEGYGGNEGLGLSKSGQLSGSGRPVAPIPRRRFLLLQDEDREAIKDVFGKWLDERIAHNMTRANPRTLTL